MIAFTAHPQVWLLIAALGGGYVLLLRRIGPGHVPLGEAAATRRERTFFGLGLLTLWLAADWPVHDLSERYLFSVHMAQHLVFSLVSAPLLIMGTPQWLARWLLRPKWVMNIWSRITRPLAATLLFNGFIVVSHWPVFVDSILQQHAFHLGAHLTLYLVSFVMWWPVLSKVSEAPRISSPAQMLYLFIQTIVPTVPASFMTFAETPFYRFYELAPRLFEISAVSDQRVAGLIMKLGGGMILWSVIAVLFFRWAAREESGVPDPAEWQRLEAGTDRRAAAKK